MARVYEKGLVSVGLPVYNGADKMVPALESILEQTYTNLEIIISDNASTDQTGEICQSYVKKDKRIRYFRQPHNTPQVPNLEFVVKKAQGEYFMLGADDDWWDPRFVENAKQALDTYPNYGVAINSVRRVYPDGENRDEVRYTGALDLREKGYAEVFDMMSSEHPIHWFCGLLRTELLHNLLRIPFPKCKAHDRVFMCELALATHIYTLPDVLYHKLIYRQSAAERYSGESIGALYRDSKAHSKYVWAIVSRLLRSKNIPLGRKLRIYPVHLTAFVWRNRVFLREWFPRAFKAALRVKAALR